jgi:hypothetical protein
LLPHQIVAQRADAEDVYVKTANVTVKNAVTDHYRRKA